MEDILYKPNKTKDDVSQLMTRHKNLIYFVLTRNGCLHDAECESAAYEGLWNAVATFDVYSDTAFSSYAYTCIRNAINDTRRKIKRYTDAESISDISTLDFNMPVYDCAIEVESEEAVMLIRTLTGEYIASLKEGSNPNNIMKVWYASNFMASVKNIASVCETSSANVSRVQATFRAYLQTKLRGR